ncbi:Stage 0 sporulation protein KA,oligopeptide ABC transporter substrate-binding protein OppA,ABC-type oligopeptide transport system, periplasmic component,nickel ABC transporter, nickel/metallophore periplasmic binding protein,Bacterial extracellular solute-binding proteins, family 5 Middle [Chlamydia serpentis]|uniref:Solute-binding protein family 5 domain-containing protein n=1 Tax=Chlamydia serpentis TaxID=1967782 RepID=A0A2R8FAC7_9CHLA|nr:peptide ABC transporter substrate-binding protein [Chlamydia serpentis]SPN73354.1 Stage 0 sporulation protein KA,oligopeptide ABC transporter substrate-binding protein OppA,ABC-type oligopeptide transport system, periplasmic component,nickel ABC transporter, nickel/metallophore periplasmic binding protein,Bacterial extracellular solute-binding proteins, family 5 Middle [Chlamydia serpentis]
MKIYRLKYILKSLIAIPWLLLSLLSCSRQGNDLTKNTLIIAMSHDPATLDPRNTYLSRDASLAKALYEGLTRITHKGVELALAESYTLSEDNTVYTFKLRPSLWSDGTPLTAYDFQESWRQMQFKEFSCSRPILLSVIKNSSAIVSGERTMEALGIHARDDLTLEILLEHPCPHFLELLAHPAFSPVHKSLRDYNITKYRDKYISNGPFILKKYEHQNYLSLEKNPLYYDHQSVHLDSITLKIIPDPSTAIKLFKNKSIDWIGSPWSSAISNEVQQALPKEKVHFYPVSSTTLLIYNLEKPPTQNKALRKAIAYAIDRTAILRLVSPCEAAFTLVPPNLSQLNIQENISMEERHNKARAYFKEAKQTISDEELSQLNILYPIESFNFCIAIQEIQRQLKEVLGLKIKIQGIEYHCFLKKRRQGDFFMASAGWIAEYLSPMSFLRILGNPRDLTKWKNHDYEQTLANLNYAVTYQDHLKSKDYLKSAETMIEEETPIIPLYHSKYVYAINPKIQNTFGSLLGHMDLKNVEVVN